MDIGQPKDYLQGMRLYLDHLKNKNRLEPRDPNECVGNVLIVSALLEF